MQPTLCSRCKKNVAVIFITRIENGESHNEGLCLRCARELHIKPVDEMMEKLGISDFWVLVAILVFGGIFGFAGMLLGVPVFAVLYTVIGDRVNKRLARKRHPLQTSLYYTIRTVDDLPPVTEPSYTSAAEEPAYETQIDPDDDMEIDDPDYDDIPG